MGKVSQPCGSLADALSQRACCRATRALQWLGEAAASRKLSVRKPVHIWDVAVISGHKTLTMVLRYVNVHGGHIDAAISALDGSFSDAVTPELHTPAIPDQPETRQVVAISAGLSVA
ncbi:MAG: hypothetical protein ACR2KH_03490 [Sphingomicrobium sp.]